MLNRLSVCFLTIMYWCNSFAADTFSDGEKLQGSWKTSIIPNYYALLDVGRYFVYKPKKVKSHSLMVMLHGCGTSATLAEDFLRGSGMLERADRDGFIVLLPQQTPNLNVGRCWNWFLALNYSYRADHFPLLPSNEPGLLLRMIDTVVTANNLDPKKVFLTGMSAGAVFAANMASCYPERFQAYGLHSGTQYRAAAYLATRLDVYNLREDLMQITLHPDDEHLEPVGESAEKAFRCAQKIGFPIKAIIFHGTKDPMNVGHAARVLSQFLITSDYFDDGIKNDSLLYTINRTETEPSAGRYGHTYFEFRDQNAKLIISEYIIDGLAHAWSGGDNRWQYNDPAGPPATDLILDFFKGNGF